ncbi:lipocalin family protein [Prevotella sp. P6B1]|uniref:lipocalin family protein n=1 Tax=Prevotella sp. P6B1 TaxID=1410613 RepID=UPI00051BEB8D|nr:lipocalin family protein [Prevotella sp. P6B1]
MLSKTIFRVAIWAALIFSLTACGAGDDDGRRLGETIVGTWQRGWNQGDVVIEGDTDLKPENFLYDLFVFRGDGTYNGMVRKGTFSSYDTDGDIIYEGDYQCDNHNLKLQYTDEGGTHRTILAQVITFNETTMQIRYEEEQHHITVTFIIRKQSNESTGYSSSSTTSE